MSAGWAGGAAGGPVQAAHPGVGGLPQPLHQLPRGLAQHALVPAPVLLVDRSAPRALRRPQIRWSPAPCSFFYQYLYACLVSKWLCPDCLKLRQGSGKDRQGMALKARERPQSLPRAYIKVGCHHHRTFNFTQLMARQGSGEVGGGNGRCVRSLHLLVILALFVNN